MAVLGNNIFISLDGSSVIAGTKTDEITTEAGTIEVASATDAQWEHFIAGRKRWSVTVGWLLLTDAAMSRLLDIGTTVTVYIKNRTGSLVYSGSALITQCKLTLTRGNLAQGSFALKGSGPLTST